MGALPLLLCGAAGLVYEVLWARYLALALGDTAAAHAVVLAAFLSGLAAGSRLWGERADRASSPLRLFAGLELSLAAWGFVSPWVLAVLAEGAPGPARATLAAVLVFLPAVLVGGALPVLVDAQAGGARGRSVAWLYFLNSLGASAGALLADFLLIPSLGLAGASRAAAVLNLSAAAAAWRLAERPPPAAGRAAKAEPLAASPEALGPVFLAGFASLALETAWIRLLALVLGSAVYSFSEMLAAFIAAIALGAWMAQRLAPRDPGRAFALAQWGAAAGVLALMPVCDRMPYYFIRIAEVLERTPENYPLYEGLKFLICLLALLPSAAFLGAALPLACEAAVAASPSETGAGRAVGRVLAASAAGNVVGAALAGPILMPALGLQRLMAAAALACLAAGAWALARLRARLGGARRPLALASGAAAAAAALALWAGPWNRTFLSMGTFRLRGLKGLSFANYRRVFEDYHLLFLRDDREASVSVMRFQDGQISLLINGKADASTGKDMLTQKLMGHVPLLLRPGSRRALVVGLGSGVTAGTALLHPLAELDVVEISPAVAEASRFFASQNRDFLRDPRASLHIRDARAFVRAADRSYDVIISEPSNPWMAGIGGLFSAEFYRRCRGLLEPGGLMAQWLHVYEMSDESLAMVVRTFTSEFSRVELWHLFANDYMLVGFRDRDGGADLGATEAAYRRPGVRADLAASGLGALSDVLAMQAAGDAVLRRAGGSGPLNREAHPRLEFDAPKALFLKSTSDLFERLDEQTPAGALRLGRYLALARRALGPEDFRRIAGYLAGYRRPYLRGVFDAWSAVAPADARARLLRARFELGESNPEGALAALRELLRREPGNASGRSLAADAEEALFKARGDRAAAGRALEHLRRLAGFPDSDRAAAFARIGRLERAAGDPVRALGSLERAAALSKAPSELWLEAADLAWELNQGGRLVADLEKSLRADPGNGRAQEMYRYLNKQFQERP